MLNGRYHESYLPTLSPISLYLYNTTESFSFINVFPSGIKLSSPRLIKAIRTFSGKFNS